MYTEQDAADYRATLLDPKGIFAKAGPVEQARLVAEHDARMEYGRANGMIAPVEQYDPAAALAKVDPTRAPITEHNENFVEMINDRLSKLDGVPDKELEAMSSSPQMLQQVERDQHFQDSRRSFNQETGRWEILTPAQYLDALAEAAKPFIEAAAVEGSPSEILLRARTNFRVLQSMAAMASRMPK